MGAVLLGPLLSYPGIRYAAASRFHRDVLEYWITRFR
jgi:hypothetical protein